MGLAGEAQKVNLRPDPLHRVRNADPSCRVLAVDVDKLRLSFYSSVTVEAFGDAVVGALSSKVGLGRQRGRMVVPRCQAWTKPPKVEGGVYWQCDRHDVLPSSACLVAAEFNPQKLEDDQWDKLGASLRALGVEDVGSVYVDRYDGCVDYAARREALLLDDRRRLMDMFGIGRKGPETERTGFRAGSRLRAQLYDKTAERRSKGYDAVDGVVRFELMVGRPGPVDPAAPLYGHAPSDALLLRDLGRVPYPGGDITVRCMAYNPLRVMNHVFGSLAAYARGVGLRSAIGYSRDVFQFTAAQRDQWLSTMLPVLDHAPSAIWSRLWPTAVERVSVRLQAAHRRSL